MSAATHLYRRKAMYYWRRRLPNALASWFHKRHLFLSLQTPDPNFARRLVVDANGAPANAMNLATAQDVYFRGMWMALAQSERRYGGKIVEADDFVDQILKDRVRPLPGEFEMRGERMHQPQMSAPYQVEDNPVREEPDAVDERFKTMADLLLRKRSKAKQSVGPRKASNKLHRYSRC